MSPQACTLWYRAPELLFGATSYGAPADCWSIGCIMGELLWLKPMLSGTERMERKGRRRTTIGNINRLTLFFFLSSLFSPIKCRSWEWVETAGAYLCLTRCTIFNRLAASDSVEALHSFQASSRSFDPRTIRCDQRWCSRIVGRLVDTQSTEAYDREWGIESSIFQGEATTNTNRSIAKDYQNKTPAARHWSNRESIR